jgi:hypothetical protein
LDADADRAAVAMAALLLHEELHAAFAQAAFDDKEAVKFDRLRTS